MNSQESLAEVFVQLADAQAGDFDVVEFLQRLCDRCVELLEVDAAGLQLADPAGRLRVLASSGEQARQLEEVQVRAGEGPSVDCHRDGRVVTVDDVAAVLSRWPRFAPACRRAGFTAVHAVPLRRRERILGALTLFTAGPGPLDPATVRILRALADAATIALLHQRTQHDQSVLIGQLRLALTSRVVIEQAKGILAERTGLDPDQAFEALRRHARTHNLGLTELARGVVDGTVQLPS